MHHSCGRAAKSGERATEEKSRCNEDGRKDPEPARLLNHRVAMPVLFDDHRRDRDDEHQACRECNLHPPGPTERAVPRAFPGDPIARHPLIICHTSPPQLAGHLRFPEAAVLGGKAPLGGHRSTAAAYQAQFIALQSTAGCGAARPDHQMIVGATGNEDSRRR